MASNAFGGQRYDDHNQALPPGSIPGKVRVMHGDELSVVLFIVGTGIACGLTAMTVSGTRSKALYALGIALAIGGLLWPYIKGKPAALTRAMGELATSPVAWFVLFVLALFAVSLTGKRVPKRERKILKPKLIEPVRSTDIRSTLPVKIILKMDPPRVTKNAASNGDLLSVQCEVAIRNEGHVGLTRCEIFLIAVREGLHTTRVGEAKDRRLKAYRSGKRQVVIVAREPDGQTATMVGKSEAEGVAFVMGRVSAGATIHADEASHWDHLEARFLTKRINHSEAYSRDDACTNMAESFFSRLRRAETGIHHHIAGRYLAAYAGEMAWHEDNRRVSHGEQFLAMTGTALAHSVSRQWKGYWQR